MRYNNDNILGLNFFLDLHSGNSNMLKCSLLIQQREGRLNWTKDYVKASLHKCVWNEITLSPKRSWQMA